MGKLSLATVADGLDAMLNGQMTAQGRIAAHLVAAAEAAGRDAACVIETLDAVVQTTVLDELWITDEEGFAYLTTVRDDDGALVRFQFYADPEAQPQASKFYRLLSSAIDSDDVVTQAAQVREIDWDIYKYVGVCGVDRQRIVQVGSTLAFEEQGLLSNTYASPVMTAVLAAFGERDLLRATYTDRLEEVRAVHTGILAKQLAVQATLVEHFLEGAEAAGWSAKEVTARLRRIVDAAPISEIHVADPSGRLTLSSLPAPLPLELPRAEDLGPIMKGSARVIDHPNAIMPGDVLTSQSVTAYFEASARIVQVRMLLGEDMILSPAFVLPD